MSFSIVVKSKSSDYFHPVYKKFWRHCFVISLVTYRNHMDIMLEKLQPYGTLYEDESLWYINWVDEADWTWFLLRWS